MALSRRRPFYHFHAVEDLTLFLLALPFVSKRYYFQEPMSIVLLRIAITATMLAGFAHSLVQTSSSRRDVLTSAAAALVGTATSVFNLSPSLAIEKDEEVTLFATPSGLKYFDIKEGEGATPRYGQLLSIKYTGYVKLPNQDKQKFDSSTFLIKHGNGRTVAGLDEGLHTMKAGGIRRLIVPPKLGYVESGLGPLPENPLARYKLSKLLDDMVAVRGGNFIFDVELKSFMDDEADQGYYEDASLTPEQFNTLRTNLQKKASDAQKARVEGNSGGMGEAPASV